METFNLANIYSAAEQVKGMRSRNELLNRKQQEEDVVRRTAQSSVDPQSGQIDMQRFTSELAKQGHVERAEQIRSGYIERLTRGAQFVNSALPYLNAQNYPTFKAKMEQGGVAEPGMLPEQFNPQEFAKGVAILNGKLKETEQWGPLTQVPGAAEGTLAQTEAGTGKTEVRVKPGSDNGEPLVKVQTEDGRTILLPRSQASGMEAPSGPERLVQVELPDGRVVYMPVSQAGGTKPATGRPKVTQDNQNAAGFYDRMSRAEGLLGSYVPTTTDFLAYGKVLDGGGLMSTTANQVLSPEAQKYYQAASDWVRAKLRKESGAAIGQGEMLQEIRTYFPVPGDSPEVIEQKRGAREVATKSMHRAAGPALEQQKPAQPGQQTPAAQEITATGPNSQKIVLRNGQWVPLQ